MAAKLDQGMENFLEWQFNRTTIDGKYKERQGSQTKGEVSEERRLRAGMAEK